MITDEEFQAARDFIARDPERAAYQLADSIQRLHEANNALHAIRAFSQNIPMATTGDKKAIEFALGGRIL